MAAALDRSPLPERLPFRMCMHARLGCGGYWHVYRNEQYGITKTTKCLSRDSQPQTEYKLDCYPNQVFATEQGLRNAYAVRMQSE